MATAPAGDSSKQQSRRLTLRVRLLSFLCKVAIF